MEGNASSAVRVLIYEDLECADCAAFGEMLDRDLLPRYGAEAAFERRDFPLPKHTWARTAAVAAQFFDREAPGLGLRFRRWTLDQILDIHAGEFAEFLGRFAVENNVDPARAAASLSDAALIASVDAGYQEGVARGVRRTPTVFVMEEPFIERFTLDSISKAIESAVQGVSG